MPHTPLRPTENKWLRSQVGRWLVVSSGHLSIHGTVLLGQTPQIIGWTGSTVKWSQLNLMEETQPTLLNSAISSLSFIFTSWNKKLNAPQPQREKRAVRNSAPKLANGIKLQSQKHLSWRSSFRNGPKYPFQPGLQWASESHQYCSDAFISLALIWVISPALAAVCFFPLISVSVIFQCPIHTHCTSVCRFLKARSPWNRIPPPYLEIFLFFPHKTFFLVFSDIILVWFAPFHSLQ